MKLVLLIICCCAVIITGYLYSNYFKKKLIIFYDLLNFCDLLKTEIKLRKTTIIEIVKNSDGQFSKEFKNLIYYYLGLCDKYQQNYLSKSEENLIKNFVLSLGKNDIWGEMENLDVRKNMIQNYCNQLYDKNKREGELGLKFGVLGAVIIFIVFI